jgi:hypothetical protein
MSATRPVNWDGKIVYRTHFPLVHMVTVPSPSSEVQCAEHGLLFQKHTARSAGDSATENGAQDGAKSGTDWAAKQGIE